MMPSYINKRASAVIESPNNSFSNYPGHPFRVSSSIRVDKNTEGWNLLAWILLLCHISFVLWSFVSVLLMDDERELRIMDIMDFVTNSSLKGH